MFLYELSPITQRRASTRFDLPQPFGPTTPVRPGLDSELGVVAEALEAGQAQALEFHRPTLRSGRRTARRSHRILPSANHFSEACSGLSGHIESRAINPTQ